MKTIGKTDYRLVSFEDSDWVRIDKAGETEGMAMNWDEGLRAIHTFEGKPHDQFYVANKDGSVVVVDRATL